MSLTVHAGAARDLAGAFRFYKREAGAQVARRFLAEFERITLLLQEFPELGTPTSEDRRIYPLTGFPYSVIYRRMGSGTRILVVRHQSRDPGHGELRS